MSDGQGFRPTKGTTPRGPGTTPTTSPSGTRPQRGTNRSRSGGRRPPGARSVQSAQSAESVSDGHGHETMGTLPTTDLPTQAPDRPHRHSHRNDGGRADRRMSHRAFRSALTCASPHARTHAREVVVVLLAVPPLPSRCASWRAVRVTSVYLMSAHAPRAAATLLVIAKATSRVRTSARKCGRPCCCCGCGLCVFSHNSQPRRDVGYTPT